MGTDLPAGWEPRTDEESGRTYYVDHNMRLTTWESPIADEFGKTDPSALAVPPSRVYFVDEQSSERQHRVVRKSVEIPNLHSYSTRRVAFWLFPAVGVVTLVMALKIAGAGGDGWIEGFGSMEYDVLCTLLPSYAAEMMSDSWCSEYETFLLVLKIGAAICAVSVFISLVAFFCPRTRIMAYLAGVLMLLYAGIQISTLVLVEKLKSSMWDSLLEEFAQTIGDDNEGLSRGRTYYLAMVASCLAATDGIALLALGSAAGIGPAYALLNRYGMGCCDRPMDDTHNYSPPPPYEP